MRTIKFRAWSEELKEFVTDQLSIFHNHGEINGFLSADIESHDLVISQFTGLHDKNGKEIYEGDLIKDSQDELWSVIFLDGCFWLYRENFITLNKMMSWPEHCYPMFRVDHALYSEVIGNIYSNPELLEKKEKQ